MWLVFVIYSCALFYVVFLTPNRHIGEGIQINLIPVIETYQRFYQLGNQHFWDYYIVYWGNIFGNIVLFVPFGFLLAYLYPKKLSRIILFYALLTSAVIELTQLILQIGVCDIDDVILNVAGAAIGIFIFKRLFSNVRKENYH